MKKLGLALMATAAAVFGVGMVASAQNYSSTVTPSPAEPAASAPFTVAYENCIGGDEDVEFNVPGATPETVTAPCEGGAPALGSLIMQVSSGTATAQFSAAPPAPGTYPGTATPNAGSPVLPFTITVPGQTTPTTTAPPTGQLPETGADGVNTTVFVAIGLLLAGGALFTVAQLRRREPDAA